MTHQRSVPAPFLIKTYQLVDDSITDDVISWNEKGDAFVVWKHAEFSKDLLPKYFKHNNFSSFVRQLNTYGFRKIVPDKWEFANDNFKRDHRDLLSDIRRRKVAALPPVPAGSPARRAVPRSSPSLSNSSDDPGSTSSKNSSGSVEDHHETATASASQLAVLTEENRQLKRKNEILGSELVETKKQCVELVSFLTDCLKVGPDQIDQVMREGTCGSTRDAAVIEGPDGGGCNVNGAGDPSCLKLFGIWLKDEGKRVKG